MHLIPVVVLVLCLLGLIVRDIFFAARQMRTAAGATSERRRRCRSDAPSSSSSSTRVGCDKDYTDSMNFAVHKIDPDDKDAASVKLN